MVSLRLTNTLTKILEEVRPANPDGILRLYHCGPTVYGTPHLGNLRRFLVADLLVRSARFLGYRVRSVMNITDVGHLLDPTPPSPGMPGLGDAGQDRMLVAAEREGRSPERIAAKYTAEFFSALASLRAEPADYYPRATMHIPQMQAIIARLLERGLAYQTSSGVYVEVTAFPSYGRLSGNTLGSLQAGARVGVREEKRHPADFALWVKAPKEHLMQWDSPWGRGYPGWHIECTAMSMQLLGDTIDVHTGGVDNIFPHHENEIAQSDGAAGHPVVRLWAHNEFLELAEGKMSKSAGDVLTLRDVQAHGADPLAFRLLCFQTHYRSKLRFSWESLLAAAVTLQSVRESVRRLREAMDRAASGQGTPAVTERLGRLQDVVRQSLADDLSSPQALAALFDFLRLVNPQVRAGTLGREDLEEVLATFRKLDTVFAFLEVDAPLPSPEVPFDVRQLVADRETARQRQDFATADRLRKEIWEKGYRVEDTPTGPRVTAEE